MRVDIIEPLLEYAEIKRAGGKTCGHIIWYRDFSTGCSSCGCDDHNIDKFPLLTAPYKEVKVCLLKNPKQICLVEMLTKPMGKLKLAHGLSRPFLCQQSLRLWEDLFLILMMLLVLERALLLVRGLKALSSKILLRL